MGARFLPNFHSAFPSQDSCSQTWWRQQALGAPACACQWLCCLTILHCRHLPDPLHESRPVEALPSHPATPSSTSFSCLMKCKKAPLNWSYKLDNSINVPSTESNYMNQGDNSMVLLTCQSAGRIWQGDKTTVQNKKRSLWSWWLLTKLLDLRWRLKPVLTFPACKNGLLRGACLALPCLPYPDWNSQAHVKFKYFTTISTCFRASDFQ